MDLSDRLGFKADLNLDTGQINFGEVKPTLVLERRLSDMRQVLAEPLEGNDDPLVHKIYRMIGDTEEIIQSGLKFDITVILPQQFGREFPKTTGHYHLPLQEGIPSPDFYEVLYGEGLVMLQTEDDLSVKAFGVDAKEMQSVLIPPRMGHLTINTEEEPLVFANICIRAEHLNYEPYIQRRGGAFYLFNGNNKQFVPNKNYGSPSLGKLSPKKIPVLSGLESMPFYPLLKEQANKLEFLTQPHNYLSLFSECLR